jgi:hypothetical protein
MKYTRITSGLLGLVWLCCQTAVQSAGTTQPAPWRFITLNAPAQTVAVEAYRRTYSASFQHETIIAANGRATGTLLLTAPDGSQRRVQAFAAVVHWHDNQVQRIRLRTREVGPGADEEIVVIIYPAPPPHAPAPTPTPTPGPSSDCLIYTTVGTFVNVTFEAQGRLAVIR